MNALVATSHHSSPHRSDGDVVSPELVLVDEVLAASARAWLPDPTDSLTRTTPAPRPADGSEALVALATAALAVDEPPATRSRYWGLAGAAASVVVVLVLLDVHVEVGRTPASAERSTLDDSPAATTAGTEPAQSPGNPPPSGTSGRTAAPQPRRFAWAPTANASRYHIELFRGTKRVFSGDTTQPQITIPAYWRVDGTRRSLTPGDYRWYVWPVVSGQRATQAIVQANLAIP